MGISGTKFCCLLDDVCTTDSHKKQPKSKCAEVKPGLFLSEGSIHLYLQPRLPVGDLSQSVIETTNMTKEDMRNEFTLLINQKARKDAGIDTFARATLKKSVEFKTPMKSSLSDDD